jgi:cytoplasmic FMR1 interacting protein
MSFLPKTILEKCPSLKKFESEWLGAGKESDYLLTFQFEEIKKNYTEFMYRFQYFLNKMKMTKKSESVDFRQSAYMSKLDLKDTLSEEMTSELKLEAKNIAEQGLKYLASWKTSILEQTAWKYGHPADIEKCKDEAMETLKTEEEEEVVKKETTEDVPPNENKPTVLDYERVVRYNYTSEERSTLVSVISMIKSVEKLLLKHTTFLKPFINNVIQNELQEFIQVAMVDIMNRATSKKRVVITLLTQLRALAGDFSSGKIPELDSKSASKTTKRDTSKRDAPPSNTQLQIIRSTIQTLISDRSPGMHKTGIFGSIDFSSSQISQINQFIDSSFMWSYLISFNTSCRKASDLADLWYREFYLELSRRIQFPIKMSLPWLITEDIIEKRDTEFMESILYPLDVYNDAAYHALFVLKRKFLYDEIEAEVNLVFDQLVFKLSEQIYAYFKILASNITLDTQFRVFIEKLQKESRFQVPKSRYDVILSQKHINLLGRSIDLNYLLTQRINISVRENLVKAIQKFESSNICSIIDLESMIDNIKMTHKLLSQYLSLDTFESMMSEVNDSISAVSFEGRISRHVIEEVCFDLFPNYIYNSYTQRFVKGAKVKGKEDDGYERERAPRIPFYYQYGSKGFNNSTNQVNDQFRGFFGHEHVRSIIRLIGQDSLTLVIETCISYIEDKVYNDIGPYIQALIQALPPQIKLQPHNYVSQTTVLTFFF